jgi:hypothetical protein
MEGQARSLGRGPLTPGLVLSHALGMLRFGFRRIALVALLLFVPPSVLAAAVTHTLADFEGDPSGLLGLGLLVSVVISATFRLLGPVVFAGYLDEAVGAGYFYGHQHRFEHVLRSLPWGRLLVADLLVVGGSALAAAAFILPAFAFYMLFGLVGPVLVQERQGLRAAFVRTMRLSLTALPLVALLVLVPTLLELTLHELVFVALHGFGLAVEIVTEWLLAAVIGGSIGVVEVALATELMARNPEPVGTGAARDSAPEPVTPRD